MVVHAGVLVHSKEEFDSRIQEISKVGDAVHIDFADGRFVPNRLFSMAEVTLPEDRFCEAHLMVCEPQTYFSDCQKLGFKKVIVHLDSLENSSYSEALRLQELAHSMSMSFCLAFKRGCIIEKDSGLDRFDSVLIMTIELGFSGQPFAEDQLLVIESIRKDYPDLEIEVDGHITNETVSLVKKAGASIVVSTSYLVEPDIQEKFLLLKNG
jgi:ribulose-phosphate 3-epimerase